jgi:hypothetical protein
MNKRIRYSIDAEGCHVSNRIIETTSGEVMVKFNLSNRVVIICRPNGVLLDTFVSTTSHKIKIDIKKKLVSMGAEFEPETRNREKEDV